MLYRNRKKEGEEYRDLSKKVNALATNVRLSYNSSLDKLYAIVTLESGNTITFELTATQVSI